MEGKSETTPVGQIEGTFYILSSEPTSDENLDTIALAKQDVISSDLDTWQQISFSCCQNKYYSNKSD